MSVCAKFQLPSMSRSERKVCCGVVWCGLAVATMSNLNRVALRCFQLSLFKLSEGWILTKWVEYHPTQTPTQTQYPKYISCYRSNFDQTLKVSVNGFCDYPKKMTNVQAAFVLVTIENLSKANPTHSS